MEKLNIDKNRTALVVIDLQKGIAGMPTRPRAAEEVVANAAKLADACRQNSMPVFLVHVSASPDGKDRLQPEADQLMQTPGKMPADWSEIVPAMGPKEGDFVVAKKQWGAFYGTELDLQLRRRKIDTIILCGIATSIGVESTARCAYEYGYSQIFAEDAMASRSDEEHASSVKNIFPRMGRVRKTDEIVAAL
jgi:nicotinamidase-related amidase